MAPAEFHRQAHDAKPFFVWFNSTRMHIFTHPQARIAQGVTGLGVYPDGMVEHDGRSASFSRSSTTLASRTTPSSSTHRQRRGGVYLAGRRHHAVPRREELELGRRLSRRRRHPLARRHQARRPRSTTLLVRRTGFRPSWPRPAAGHHREAQEAATTPTGRPSGSISTATTSMIFSRRRRAPEFFYWTDDGDLAGLRYDEWKVVFLEQQHEGLRVGQESLTPLRVPLLCNLRSTRPRRRILNR